MPASLLPNLNTSSKKIKLTILFALSPLFFFAQSLTGLWVGALSNDSTTIRKDQSFEIALTEYRGKVYGYSRSEFIVDDVLYYIVKRVKGTIEGDMCEVTDDEIISYNFPGKLDKKVKVISTFRKDKGDDAWHLDGKWKTNTTKKYYSVSGKVALEQEKDLTASKIFPHLEELKLADEVAFYKDRKEGQPIVKIAKPEKVNTEYAAKAEQLLPGNDITTTTNNTIAQKAVPTTIPVKPSFSNVKGETGTSIAESSNKPKAIVAKEPETKMVAVEIIKTNTPATTKPVEEKKAMPVAKVVTKQEAPVTKPLQQDVIKQPETKKPEATNTTAVKTNTIPVNTVTPEKKEVVVPPVIAEIKKPDVMLKAALIAGRKSEFSQVVNFKSDSLQISLYDNGEIDGDTVSVFMNGVVLLANQGLKSAAIRKTIYLTPGKDDEFTLVMFAESLGKYPPNTGLLVIHDGDDVYNLRFSSDFQKNAGIVFRRKK